MRRATQTGMQTSNKHRSFQSTLSMRRATGEKRQMAKLVIFQSTLSMRRATTLTTSKPIFELFQSTLSMRRATGRGQCGQCSRQISIHALHEESDSETNKLTAQNLIFQSTLSMRRATKKICIGVRPYRFQSTLSMRRATVLNGVHAIGSRFQSTLSMRRATVPPR